MKIELHPEAEDELLRALAWYAERSAIAARAYTTELNSCMRQIEEAPKRWKSYMHGTRRLSMSNFPFSVIYRVGTEAIEVVALAHHRRRPGYWSKRL